MTRWLTLSVLAAAACSGSDEGDTAEPTMTIDCGSDYDIYAPGLAASGQSYTVTFLSADPAPPDRGDNVWSVEVSDASGIRDDLGLTVEPFMPEHGHGTSPASFTGSSAAGAYDFEPIDLFMPGLWVLTFYVDDGLESDPVEFRFCLEG